MGKLNHQPNMTHFSHPHPLELSNLQHQSSSTLLSPPSCSCCKVRISGWAYQCAACKYFLHITCSQMPQLIHHPFDPNHALSLLPVPAYPERTFRCDACGRQGDGFSYHCGVCGLDVHALCASMPLSVTHAAHAHPLGLEFFPPYNNKGFSCDVCRGTGSNHWLYRCAACEFDAHLSCATAKAGPALSPGLQQQSPGPQQTQLQNRPFYGQQYQHLQPQSPRVQQFQTLQQQPLRPQQYQLQQQQQQQQLLLLQQQQQQQQLRQQHLLQQQQMFSSPRMQARPNGFVQNNAQNYQQTGSGQALNSLMNQVLQGVIDGASQQTGQNLVQGITGGGDGGGGGGDGGGDDDSGSVFDVGGVFGGSDESSS